MASEKITVEIEGRKVPVPTALTVDDDTLRRALASLFPWAMDARIDRAKESEGLLKVVKAAGTKGRIKHRPYAIRRLSHCKGGKNPIIELYQKLAGTPLANLDPVDALAAEKKIQSTLALGEEHMETMKTALARLDASVPRPSPFVPLGF